jgi:hypothetical protein
VLIETGGAWLGIMVARRAARRSWKTSTRQCEQVLVAVEG